MRLGLSSAAAPDATLEELLDACARRGLAALELRDGDGHRVGDAPPGGVSAAEAVGRARAGGVAISGFRSQSAGADARLLPVARSADAPVLVGGGNPDARFCRAIQVAREGGRAAVVLEGDPASEQIERAASYGLELAWDVVPSPAAAATAERLVTEAGGRLRQIRIQGGGPEAVQQEGSGIGGLMAVLALGGYAGALVLAPSSAAYRVAWSSWLGRRGGWGCGSSADRSLVVLGAGSAPRLGSAR